MTASATRVPFVQDTGQTKRTGQVIDKRQDARLDERIAGQTEGFWSEDTTRMEDDTTTVEVFEDRPLFWEGLSSKLPQERKRNKLTTHSNGARVTSPHPESVCMKTWPKKVDAELSSLAYYRMGLQGEGGHSSGTTPGYPKGQSC